MNSQTFQPYLVAANLTRRCNLKCNHCYLDAGGKSQEENHELSTEDWTSLFSQIAERAASELPYGSYVNLGLGIPTLVSNYLKDSQKTISKNNLKQSKTL